MINEKGIKMRKNHRDIEMRYRTPLTLIVCYEILALCVLQADEYEVFEYVVICLFVPIVIGVLFSWRREISVVFRRLWFVLTYDNKDKKNK